MWVHLVLPGQEVHQRRAVLAERRAPVLHGPQAEALEELGPLGHHLRLVVQVDPLVDAHLGTVCLSVFLSVCLSVCSSLPL